VVNIDTVASRPPAVSGICHDKHRASNGCAASVEKAVVDLIRTFFY
jgi:hypothetical protein